MLSASSSREDEQQLSGVRSSWLMFARNSLLYFERERELLRLLLERERAPLDLAVLLLDLLVLLGEQRGLLLELLVDLLQLLLLLLEQLLGLPQRLRLRLELRVRPLELVLLPLQLLRLALQLLRQRLRLLSSSSVRMFAPIMLSTTPIDSASWSRKVWWIWLNGRKLASSITAFTSPSNRIGRTMMLRGGASPSPDVIWM